MKNSRFLAFGRSFCFLVVCFVAGALTVNAQPLARFVLPTNTTGISTTPTFEIITAYPIDTSSVFWNWGSSDSTTYSSISVCVIPYSVYSTDSDTFWYLNAAGGTGTFINDTTISFTSYSLQNEHEFVAILMGLRVINGSDTITIPDTVARLTFTTAKLPPSLLALTVFDSNQIVRTHDTITATFSEKLDSANTPSGPLLSTSIPLTTFDTIHDTVIVTDSAITTTAWLDASDSTKIHLLPSHPFAMGQNYDIKVKLSRLTGDTTQDGSWGFICKKSFLLNVTAAATSGLSPTCLNAVHFDPTINENFRAINDSQVVFDTNYIGKVVNAGDTVTYTAPTHVGGAVFLHWSGSGILAIDTSTNPVLTITQTADQLKDMNIIALFGPVAVDTVCTAVTGINNPTHNQDFVVTTSDSLDCPLTTLNDTCTTTSSVNYLLERGKVVTMHAYSLYDSATFSHWLSSNSAINGLTSPVISFATTGNTCATAVFVPPTPGMYQLNDYVFVDGVGPADPSIAQIIAPVPAPATTYEANSSSTVCGTAQAATLKIMNRNYGLESYFVSENPSPICHNVITDQHDFTKDGPSFQPKDLYVASGAPYPCAGDGTFTPPNPPDATQDDLPATTVTFLVKPIIRKLIIVLRTDNNTQTEGTFLTFTDPTTSNSGATGMWLWVKTPPLSWKHIQGYWTYSSFPFFTQTYHPKPDWCGYSQPTYEFYELTYTSGTTVELEAGTASGSGDNFVHWELPCSPVSSYCGCTNTEWPTIHTTADFSFAMSEDEAATATYHVPFKLVSVGFLDQPNYGSSTTQGITKNVNNWGTRQGGVTGSGTPWPQSTYTGVRFDFNKAVKANSSGMVPIEFNEERAEFNKNSSDMGSFWAKVASSPAPPSTNAQIAGNSMYFWLDANANSKEYRLWKGQNFNFNVSSSVTSFDNESLSNPKSDLPMSTINPEVSWYYHKTRINTAHDGYCDNTEWVEVAGGIEPGATMNWLSANWFFTCMETNVEDNNDYLPDPYISNQACSDACTGGTDILIATNGATDPGSFRFNAGAEGIIHKLTTGSPFCDCTDETWPCARHDEETDHGNMASSLGFGTQSLSYTNIGDQVFHIHDKLTGHAYCTGTPGNIWLSAEWNQANPLGAIDWWGYDKTQSGIWTQSNNPSTNSIDLKIVLQ